MQAIKRKEGDARNEGGRRNPPGIRDLFVSSGESLTLSELRPKFLARPSSNRGVSGCLIGQWDNKTHCLLPSPCDHLKLTRFLRQPHRNRSFTSSFKSFFPSGPRRFQTLKASLK
jgi:hypothetical protein